MNALQFIFTFITLALCSTKTTAEVGLEDNLAFPLELLTGGPSDPNAQILPCILYIRETDYQDGTDGHLWECRVFGPDAATAGALPGAKHAMVKVEGMDLVLASNPNLMSGVTTLYTKQANLENHVLTISEQSELFFHEDQPAALRRRKLAAKTGDLDLLVVRVTTNDASLTYDAREIGDNVFGTHGDQVNLKTNIEDCSNNDVTISPASGSGASCEDLPFGGLYRLANGAAIDCEFMSRLEVNGLHYCGLVGNWVDIDGGSATANTACCACGGGVATTYSNTVTDGVLDLTIDFDAIDKSRNVLEEEVGRKLEDLFKTDHLGLVIDLVMICVPEGTFRESDNQKDWLAYSYIGGYLSVYNGQESCGSAKNQAHEVGHNFGLRHSNEVTNGVIIEYGDGTGVMGYGIGALDEEIFGNKFCYNGAHSWVLGWYDHDSIEIDPMTETFDGALAGVDKLPNLAGDEKIVLKLSPGPSNSNYYLMFNHAFGANQGTLEAQNQVTLTSMATSNNAFTYLLAKLGERQYATFEDYDGEGTKLTVYVKSIDATDNGRAEVQVFKGTYADRPTESPTAGPTSGPTSGPTVAPTKESEDDNDNDDKKNTESAGDPHFKTWKDEHFEFHGQCDIVMASNKEFASGLGVDIHLRTKMVRFWSFIKAAAIKIGNDILEVEGVMDQLYGLKYWINHEPLGELTTLGGFPVSVFSGAKPRFTIDLDSVYPGQKIEIKIYKEFVGVKIIGATMSSFGGSVGITGDFSTGKTLARDGVTVLDDFNELGCEWQVLPSDGKLFHDNSRPQFPEQCLLPEDPRGERTRRLAESMISEEAAEKACAALEDEFSRKGCVYDILATQDIDMAGAY